MRIFARIVGVLALGLTLFPPILVAMGRMDNETSKILLLVATIVWFASAPVAYPAGRAKAD